MHLQTGDESFEQSPQLKLLLLRAAEIEWGSKQSTKFTSCSRGNSPPCAGQEAPEYICRNTDNIPTPSSFLNSGY